MNFVNLVCICLFYISFWVLNNPIVLNKIPDIFLNGSTNILDKVIPFSTFKSEGNELVELSVTSKPSWLSTQLLDPQEIMEFQIPSNFYSSKVFVSGEYAFVIRGGNLLIYDISNRECYVLVSERKITYRIYTIYVSGNFVYLATDGYVHVVDVTIKNYPVLVGEGEVGSNPLGIFVEDDYLYVGDDSSIKIFDAKNTGSRMELVGVIEGNRLQGNLYVQENYVFCCPSYDKFEIYDTSTKESPILVSSFPLGEDLSKIYCNSVHVEGSFAIVTGHVYYFVIDISNIYNTTVIYQEITSRCYGRASVFGNILYRPCGSRVHIYNITENHSIEYINSLDISTGSVFSVDDNNILYISANTDDTGPLTTIDFSKKGDPKILQQEELMTGITDIEYDVKNNLVYSVFSASDDYGSALKVFDVSNPETPIIIGEQRTSEDWCKIVATDAGYVYVLSNWGLRILDFSSDISQPILVGALDFEKECSYCYHNIYSDSVLQVSRNFLFFYCDFDEKTVFAVDISNVSFPIVVASYVSPFWLYDISVLEEEETDKFMHVFVADDNGMAILLFDIENNSLSLVTSYDLSDEVMMVTARGSYAYISRRVEGFFVLDISNKSSPVVTGQLPRNEINWVYCQDVREDNVYILDLDNVLKVISVKDKSNPKLIYKDNLGGGVLSQVSARGNYIGVARGENGLVILRHGDLMLSGDVPLHTSYCEKVEVVIEGKDSTGSAFDSFYVFFDTIENSNENVCAGHGDCDKDGLCECYGGYTPQIVDGPCTDWSCGERKYYDSLVCSGKGKCSSPDECHCDVGYSGNDCKNNVIATTLYIALPVIFVLSISVIGILFCVLVACCFVVTCLIASFLTLYYLTSTIMKQKKGITKYRKLKEQLLDESDSGTAFLKINKNMFKINYDDLQTLEAIGSGGSNSLVIRSLWEGRVVAFKCFKTRLLYSTQEEFNEFEREVAIMGSISHPNIIRFFGCTLKSPRVGIVMEFCENGEILDFFEKKNIENGEPYPQLEKLRMVTEIISALAYLHGRRIIHRDLKCENILVDGKECTRVMDFGLSRIVEKNVKKLTQKIGTNVYMAPEIVGVVGDGFYDEKCDVFSFAITLYVIFTENPKPYGDNDEYVQFRVSKNPSFRPKIETLLNVLEEKYVWIAALVEKCWNHDAKERPSFVGIREHIEAIEKML